MGKLQLVQSFSIAHRLKQDSASIFTAVAKNQPGVSHADIILRVQELPGKDTDTRGHT